MKHILVATDFSTRSDRALRRAAMLARALGARLSLVHVVDDDQPAHLVRSQVAGSWPVLEASVRTLARHDAIEAEANVVTGDAAAGILAAADEADADLIVLGPHRRQLRDLFVGTTAERTVVRSSRPVLLAAGVPAAPWARALIALDLEEGARGFADHVRTLGLPGPVELVAMHAFDAPSRGMMRRAMMGDEAIDDFLRAEAARAARDLRKLVGDTGLGAAQVRAVPLDSTAARTIRACAAEEEAGLIVVGASRRTGLERLLLGSAAADLLGSSDRDVLVVPAASAMADA